MSFVIGTSDLYSFPCGGFQPCPSSSIEEDQWTLPSDDAITKTTSNKSTKPVSEEEVVYDQHNFVWYEDDVRLLLEAVDKATQGATPTKSQVYTTYVNLRKSEPPITTPIAYHGRMIDRNTLPSLQDTMQILEYIYTTPYQSSTQNKWPVVVSTFISSHPHVMIFLKQRFSTPVYYGPN
jgi:hypothetical protein